MGLCCDKPADAEHLPEQREDMSPINDRGCRDLLWFLIAIAAGIASIAIASVALEEGDLDKLRYGISSNDTLCSRGVENGKDRLIFCFNGTTLADGLSTDNLVFSVCAATCPTTTDELISIYEDKKDEFEAATHLNDAWWSASDYLLLRTACVAPTTSVLNRCVYDFSIENPVSLGFNYNLTDPGGDSLVSTAQMFLNSYNDVATTWYVILVCGIIGGLFISFLWLQLLQMLTDFIVWLSIIFFLILVFCLDYLVAIKAGYADGDNIRVGEGPFTFQPQVEEETQNYYKALFWVFFTFTCIFVLMLMYMFNRIRLAIALVKEAAVLMRTIPQLILTPVIPVVMVSLIFLYGMYIAAYLASAGTIEDGDLKWDRTLRYMMFFHGFTVLWALFFVEAFHTTNMAGVVATYYWAKDKGDLPAPVMRSVYRHMRYHLGSLAFGSLILTLVRLIKWALMYMAQKLKKHFPEDSKAVKFVLCCINCCLNCVENFIQYLTRNAYVMIAVDGHSFCHAAGQAFKLIMSNVARMTAVNFVCSYVFFLSRITVGLLAALCATLWIDNALSLVDNTVSVTSAFVPSVLTFLIAFIIATLFYAVVDTSIDTLLLCFCLDDIRNRDTGEYYASRRLLKFMAVAPKMKSSDIALERKGEEEAK